MAKAGLNKKEWSEFSRLIEKAKNSELYKMEELLFHELDLSNTCIAQGEEKKE